MPTSKFIVEITVAKETRKAEGARWIRDVLVGQARREGWSGLLTVKIRQEDRAMVNVDGEEYIDGEG